MAKKCKSYCGSNYAANCSALERDINSPENANWKIEQMCAGYDNLIKKTCLIILYDDGVTGTSEVTE